MPHKICRFSRRIFWLWNSARKWTQEECMLNRALMLTVLWNKACYILYESMWKQNLQYMQAQFDVAFRIGHNAICILTTMHVLHFRHCCKGPYTFFSFIPFFLYWWFPSYFLYRRLCPSCHADALGKPEKSKDIDGIITVHYWHREKGGFMLLRAER